MARKIFFHMMVSLDGFTEGPNNELDWHFVDEEYEKHSNETLRSIDAILLGRRTYELFAAYWPQFLKEQQKATHAPVPDYRIESAELLNSLPKYVVSKSLNELKWNNSHLIKDEVEDNVQKLKSMPGRNIALFGSAKLASSLMDNGLIDEFRLIVNPIFLGEGNPLIRKKIKRKELHLAGVKKFRSGALELTYHPSKTNETP